VAAPAVPGLPRLPHGLMCPVWLLLVLVTSRVGWPKIVHCGCWHCCCLVSVQPQRGQPEQWPQQQHVLLEW
jgi:hypothetical protein